MASNQTFLFLSSTASEYHGQVVDIVLLADQLEEFELFLAEHRIEFVHLLRCKLLELELFINGIPKTSFGSIFRVLNECQMDKLQHCLKQIDWCFLLFSFSFSFSFTFAFILFLRWISFQILLLFLIYPFIFYSHEIIKSISYFEYLNWWTDELIQG